MVGSKSPMAVDGHVLSVQTCGNFPWWRWWTKDGIDMALQHSALQSKKERIHIINRRNQVVQSRSNWSCHWTSWSIQLFISMCTLMYFVCCVCFVFGTCVQCQDALGYAGPSWPGQSVAAAPGPGLQPRHKWYTESCCLFLVYDSYDDLIIVIYIHPLSPLIISTYYIAIDMCT